MADSKTGPHLELRQSQNLVMTPQLQQAIKILQMDNVELGEFLVSELERNPLLEREDDVLNQSADTSPSSSEKDSSVKDDFPRANEPSAPESEPEPDTYTDTDYDNTFTGNGFGDDALGLQNWRSGKGAADFYDDESSWLEHIEDNRLSLREHLTSQINLDIKNEKDRLIAVYLIDFLDDAGYLTLDAAAAAASFQCSPAHIEKVVSLVQGLNPVGVFARNLKECLALQLKDKNRFDPAMQALLDNLDLLGKKDFKALEKICQVSAEDLRDMVAEIQKLDPKPAAGFNNHSVATLIPDVLMKKDKSGNFVLELNPETLPKILLNSSYITRLNSTNLSKTDKKTANGYLNSANWLIKTLNQRSETILKIAISITDFQKDFFTKGIEYLKPLTLKDIAADVSMHESTVSRVTTGKYIATPLGVFELKYFFSSALGKTSRFGGGVAGNGGKAGLGLNSAADNLSAKSVQYKIKEMIEKESADAILSDEQIAYLLQKEGIEIARRTVAKYREAMRIATSSVRRREKQINKL